MLPIEDFSSSIRSSAMASLPAYLAFFCLENAVRELINDRLSELHGAEWWDVKASSALRKKVEDRRDKEGANRWHVARGAHAIYYTDFGDLRSLLQNNWPDFEDLFPDQNWVLSRIGELELSRNVIAHSNTLDEREMIRIRLYLQDWIKQVG
ncbi:Swt1 family HEPN domain-containing protein [Blastococcus sp. TBT05-19]|uniref:Swt1 family HEPN domain-containing protein n=1 Tax=Blastococcus sp. TBT05-19 TaxID=2250581 RepID=UPI0011BD6A38|nr:Swt1 family HEPN domain-containing protein [Blastococcus sp. TBT05-19]